MRSVRSVLRVCSTRLRKTGPEQTDPSRRATQDEVRWASFMFVNAIGSGPR